MSEKRFNGKAIYNPSGKAGEYSYWACNFYVGCSNLCEYCYCRKGILSNVMGQSAPLLKKCFKNEADALTVFKKELMQNRIQLQQHGLFFSFTTDPMLEETHKLHWEAIYFAMENDVPVKILTKCVGAWIDQLCTEVHPSWGKNLAIGFTLTGHDELEGNSASTKERIRAMEDLHKAGYKTFSSIEPIIDLGSSLSMIHSTVDFCDLYKVGLLSGKKYDWRELRGFMLACTTLESKFYFKDSFISKADLDRANLPQSCVGRDYDMFFRK